MTVSERLRGLLSPEEYAELKLAQALLWPSGIPVPVEVSPLEQEKADGEEVG